MSATTKTIGEPGSATKTFDHAMAGLKDGVASATHGPEAQRAGHRAGPWAMPESMTAAAKQIFAFHQANMTAFVQSGRILADGVQDVAKQMAANARTTMDEGMQAFQAITSAASPKHAMDVQTGFVRTSCERAMGDANRLAETSMRLGEQAAAPLSARLTAAAGEVLPQR